MQIEAPLADRGLLFTALFEYLVIDWLRETKQSAIVHQLELRWHEVDINMSQAVAQGLALCTKSSPTRIKVVKHNFRNSTSM